MAKGRGTNVGSIYGSIQLDNSQFKGVLQQSKGDMAKTALAMQAMSRVKVDVGEWKKLTAQMHALQGRAQETRLALIKTPAGTAEAKKLSGELKGLESKVRLLKSATEPARKELERLAKAERDVGAASRFKAPSEIGRGLAGRMPGAGGMMAGAGMILGEAAMSSPYVAAAIAALAALAAGAVVAGLAIKGLTEITAAAVVTTGKYAEEMLNLSQKTGIGTDQLQELKYVSDVTGLSFDTLMRGVMLFERKMPEIRKGTGAAADALRQLGISATDSTGQFRSMDDLYPAIISRLQSMTNEMDRNATAGQLFGRGWAEIAPILGMSAGKLQELMKQARALGLVLTGPELKAAAELDDQFDMLKAAAAGLMRQLGAAVTPALLDAAKKIAAEMPGWIEDAKKKFKEIEPFIKELVDSFMEAYEAAKPFVKELLGLGGATILGNLKLAALAFDALRWSVEQFEAIVERLRPIIEPMLAPLRALAWLMGIEPGWGQAPALPTPPQEPPKGLEEDPERLALTDAIARKTEELKRVMFLQGDGTEYAAMRWELLNGEFKEATDQEKRQLTLLAKQKDAMDAQRKAAEESARASTDAISKQVDALRDQFNAYQEWARKMVDSARNFANDVVGVVRDQIKRENDAKDKQLDDDKSRYDRLRELGRAGAMALTNVVIFGKKAGEEKPLTAADMTPERIQAAAAEIVAQRRNEAEIQAAVQKQLYGDSISRYEQFAKAGQPDWESVKGKSDATLLNRILAVTSVLPAMLVELQKVNRPTVSSGIA